MPRLFSLLDDCHQKFELWFRYCPVEMYFLIYFDQSVHWTKKFLVDYSRVKVRGKMTRFLCKLFFIASRCCPWSLWLVLKMCARSSTMP